MCNSKHVCQFYWGRSEPNNNIVYFLIWGIVLCRMVWRDSTGYSFFSQWNKIKMLYLLLFCDNNLDRESNKEMNLDKTILTKKQYGICGSCKNDNYIYANIKNIQ